MRSRTRARIAGSGSKVGFLPDWDGLAISTQGLTGVIAHDVDDQVVEVWAGTPVAELQIALIEHGQCLPLTNDLSLAAQISGVHGTIGGLIAMNLPHALSSQCGGPRDWTLGMTVVRTDGTLAKCGSKAVKNVAGYDAHRLLVGSRGTLGAIAKVFLRTYPVRALPTHQLSVVGSIEAPTFVARTLRTDFAATVESTPRLIASDPASCTLWSVERPNLPAESWMVGPEGERFRPEQPAKFERRAREIFDPEGKLAHGWQK